MIEITKLKGIGSDAGGVVDVGGVVEVQW